MKRSISVAVLAVSLSLAGCGSLDMIFQSHYSEYELTETQVLKKSWFTRDNLTKLEPVYCYKTLVKHECFDQVRPGDERPAVWTYRGVKQ